MNLLIRMKTYYLALFALASVFITGCSTSDGPNATVGTERSILERIPIVYRQDIQQGNVITQEMVNQLHPGLSKRQVRFAMGTPMLEDLFHQSRWDYIYTMTVGWGETEQKQVHLYFNGDQLERIEGDLKPDPNAKVQSKSELLVSVPDYSDPNRGVIKQAFEYVVDTPENTSTTTNKDTTTTPEPAQEILR